MAQYDDLRKKLISSQGSRALKDGVRLLWLWLVVCVRAPFAQCAMVAVFNTPHSRISACSALHLSWQHAVHGMCIVWWRAALLCKACKSRRAACGKACAAAAAAVPAAVPAADCG
jgi:hypothetical protein